MKRQPPCEGRAGVSRPTNKRKKKKTRPKELPIPPLTRTATNLEILESVMALDEEQTLTFTYSVEQHFPEVLLSSKPGSNSVAVDFAKLLESPRIPRSSLSSANGVTNFILKAGQEAAKKKRAKIVKPNLANARGALNSLAGGGIDLLPATCLPAPVDSTVTEKAAAPPDIKRIFTDTEPQNGADDFDSAPSPNDVIGGGDLSEGEEKRVTVYWYCGKCSSRQIMTAVDIDDVRETCCPKCMHLLPVKKVVDVTQEETRNAALVLENFFNSFDPAAATRMPSLEQLPSLSRGPSLSRTASLGKGPVGLTNPNMPALSRQLSGANAMFDLDLFRSDSLATYDDLEITRNPSLSKKGLARNVSDGFGSGVVPPPAGVARQHSLALIGDSLLSNYIENHVDDKDKSKVKLCWFCPNIECQKEIDLWDGSPKCQHCGYLKPSKTPIITLNKTFKCGICSKMFSRKHTLKEHMHIHTDQRPHACKWAFRGCTARFNDSSNKRAHEKMSCKFMLGKPEKKFVCELCPMKEEVDPVTGEKRMVYSKQYARRIDLIDHQTSKHGGNPKPYACEICGKRYANKANVSRHKKKAHVEKPSPKKKKADLLQKSKKKKK
eukprot:g4603.t1